MELPKYNIREMNAERFELYEYIVWVFKMLRK